MIPHDYRTTTPPKNIHSAKHTFTICTGIGEKIQNSRFFLTGMTFSRGVAEITVTAEISEIPVEKKIPDFWAPLATRRHTNLWSTWHAHISIRRIKTNSRPGSSS
jgi:hypothetical protein